MMSNNLATNLHLMVSIWKFETKLLTWEAFQREINPIGQLLWKKLKPHISKPLNILFLFVYSLVTLLYIAVNILKLFRIVAMFDCPSANLYKFQSSFEAIFVWVPGWSCIHCWFSPLVCYIFTDYLSNWLNVPGWSRMNCCKKKKKQFCTFGQVQYELESKPWTDPNLISCSVLVCNIWWSFSPGLVQFELVLNPWYSPM